MIPVLPTPAPPTLPDLPALPEGRVRPVLMAAALERSGVLDDDGVDAEAVRGTGVVTLLGAGRPVGEIRAVF